MKIGDKIVFSKPWYTSLCGGDDDYITRFFYGTIIWFDDKSCVIEQEEKGFRYLREPWEIKTLEEYLEFKRLYEEEYDEPEMWIEYEQ